MSLEISTDTQYKHNVNIYIKKKMKFSNFKFVDVHTIRVTQVTMCYMKTQDD